MWYEGKKKKEGVYGLENVYHQSTRRVKIYQTVVIEGNKIKSYMADVLTE